MVQLMLSFLNKMCLRHLIIFLSKCSFAQVMSMRQRQQSMLNDVFFLGGAWITDKEFEYSSLPEVREEQAKKNQTCSLYGWW